MRSRRAGISHGDVAERWLARDVRLLLGRRARLAAFKRPIGRPRPASPRGRGGDQ